MDSLPPPPTTHRTMRGRHSPPIPLPGQPPDGNRTMRGRQPGSSSPPPFEGRIMREEDQSPPDAAEPARLRRDPGEHLEEPETIDGDKFYDAQEQPSQWEQHVQNIPALASAALSWPGQARDAISKVAGQIKKAWKETKPTTKQEGGRTRRRKRRKHRKRRTTRARHKIRCHKCTKNCCTCSACRTKHRRRRIKHRRRRTKHRRKRRTRRR